MNIIIGDTAGTAVFLSESTANVRTCIIVCTKMEPGTSKAVIEDQQHQHRVRNSEVRYTAADLLIRSLDVDTPTKQLPLTSQTKLTLTLKLN